ncbi:MAG: ClpXP protease specificity-enhancing factor [Gammaproteobacteria bacterium]|nr:ClpXP protease specificity-enhancing factor [Gammaproteobacteria bacterium]
MTSTKPYLLRAFFDWINDNQLTPYLAVNADVPGTLVPRQHVEAGKITLNISPSAIRDLTLGNDILSFSARFSGILTRVTVPIKAVLAIYARENGRGMVFGEEETETDPPPSTTDKSGKPKLTIVK